MTDSIYRDAGLSTRTRSTAADFARGTVHFRTFPVDGWIAHHPERPLGEVSPPYKFILVLTETDLPCLQEDEDFGLWFVFGHDELTELRLSHEQLQSLSSSLRSEEPYTDTGYAAVSTTEKRHSGTNYGVPFAVWHTEGRTGAELNIRVGDNSCSDSTNTDRGAYAKLTDAQSSDFMAILDTLAHSPVVPVDNRELEELLIFANGTTAQLPQQTGRY